MGKEKRRVTLIHEWEKNKSLFVMALPAVLLTFTFCYLPMSGLILAFKNYQFGLGVFRSPWSGLDNFRFLFMSGKGMRVTLNTIVFNLANLITSQGLAIVLAIVISELVGKRLKKFMQSVIILPYFISWIVVGAFMVSIFNEKTGIYNNLRVFLGQQPVNVYEKPNVWIWIIMIFNLWKWAGYNSVIYTSAVTSINQECYEAADIDGANVWQRIWYITLPSIRATIMTMLLLNVGRILRGDFQMFYQIVGNNGQLFEATDVIDTYVFRSLLSGSDFGMTAAATLYQSVVCFLIITITNAIVKKVEPDYALY